MTTVGDVRKLIAPLLGRHADIALVGRLVVVTPVDHLVRGVLVSRTRGKSGFRPVWAVIWLFEPADFFFMNFGFDLGQNPYIDWDIERPDVGADLQAQIEDVALPRLRAIKTIEDFYQFATTAPFFFGNLQNDFLHRVYVETARGNFAEAEKICTRFATPPTGYENDRRYDEDVHRIAKILGPPIAARDRAAVAALLREWEAYTVRKLKLEKYWQPTPFPFET